MMDVAKAVAAKYIGADSEMVQWSDDDGSAANEPDLEFFAGKLTIMAEQIGALICRVGQLEREKEALRESRDYWVDRLADLDAPRETPAFPLNATKHSL
jgi:hypothetical protein